MSLINKIKRAASHKDNDGCDNPYVTAQRAWNGHVGGVVAARRTWQILAILALLIVLASVGGMIHIGSQSKFVPYVVEVDKLGQAVAVAPAMRAEPVDQRVLHASLASFINDARLVTPDVALQRKAVFRIYSMLMPSTPATVKMNEWYKGADDASPFKRAATETVSIEIVSVLAQTPETWQVDWTETLRDRQGVLKIQPYRMRALLTIFTQSPTSQTTDEQIRNNPLGIYVRDYSWSKQL